MLVVEEKKSIVFEKLNELCELEGQGEKNIFSLGIIDLEDGGFVGLHNKASIFSDAMLAGLAASAVMMLRGPEVCRVESFISNNTDMEISNTIQELYFCTDRITKFLKVVEGWEVLVILVSHTDANMAINWLKVKDLTSKIDKLLTEIHGVK